MERLAGRHVVVTGGGKGIGKAIAERLAAGGCDADAPCARPRAAARGGRRDRCGSGGVRRPRPRSGRRCVRDRGGRARPDPRPRRQQRARRPERRRPRRPLRRSRRDESRRHLLHRPRRSPPSCSGAGYPPPRRDRLDPRQDRGARLHGLLRVEGRPPRARSLLRGRAGGREHPGERDLPRLGRHRHGVGRAGRASPRRPAGRATTPTAMRCARFRSAGCPSRRTSPARLRGSCPTTPAASPDRRSIRTAAPGWDDAARPERCHQRDCPRPLRLGRRGGRVPVARDGVGLPLDDRRAADSAAPGVRLEPRDDRPRSLVEPALLRPRRAVRGGADRAGGRAPRRRDLARRHRRVGVADDPHDRDVAALPALGARQRPRDGRRLGAARRDHREPLVHRQARPRHRPDDGELRVGSAGLPAGARLARRVRLALGGFRDRRRRAAARPSGRAHIHARPAGGHRAGAVRRGRELEPRRP